MTGVELLMASIFDALIGDPRWLPHPVRAMGRCIAWCDCRVRSICQSAVSLRIAGMCLAVGLPLLAYLLGTAVIGAADQLDGRLGSVLSVGLASMTIAARDLWDHVQAVNRSLQYGDLPLARQSVAMIVGRDTAALSESEVARAAVETVAESTADGIIAPLLYLAIGGAPLALAYKAINTLDSMIGHKDERHIDFGWASARLDDLANWIPARVAALLLIVGGSLVATLTNRAENGWRVFRSDGGKHPSPNSGRPEAAMAGILGVRLGGANVYDGVVQERPLIGALGRAAEPCDIAVAMKVMVVASVIGVCMAAGLRWLV